MFDEQLRIAYEKSDAVLAQLRDEEKRGVISMDRLGSIVEDMLNCKIDVTFGDFAAMDPDIKDCGAMMLTGPDGEHQAKIILNKEKDVRFQRFSLVHELGHLMVEGNGIFSSNDGGYVVSTHVNYSVTGITEEEYSQYPSLLKEQQANVFALRVLMPGESFFDVLKAKDSLSEVADFYGLDFDAVVSRIMLVS